VKQIKVLGPGCPKCQELLEQTQRAVRELNLECTVVKVSDIQEITRHGVMMTPALVIDDEVKIMGRVPALDDIKKLLGA